MPSTHILSHQRRRFNPRVRPAQPRERAQARVLVATRPGRPQLRGEWSPCSGDSHGDSHLSTRPQSRQGRQGGEEGPHLRVLSGAGPQGHFVQAPGHPQRLNPHQPRELPAPEASAPATSFSFPFTPLLSEQSYFCQVVTCLHTEVKDLSLLGPQGKRAEQCKGGGEPQLTQPPRLA